jgi:hypothetical protein
MFKFLAALLTFGIVFGAAPTAVDACAGLIGSNGAVNLGRTTTLAAYHDGVEHYVTSFEFQGGGGEFGTLVPLPGIPTDVQRGGAWTLQRLDLETRPRLAFSAREAASAGAPAADKAEVLIEKRIDALDITVLRGGAASVAEWAEEHGFRLSPDAPEVLDFYAQRSPIFLAAVFDGDAALERGQALGDGTPVHLTIPTDNPWVPLRILGLGKQADDSIEADVFLMTDDLPAILPKGSKGLRVDYSAAANKKLLDDLRSDDGMAWVPQSAWVTRIGIDTTAGDLKYDLAVDATGRNDPSWVDAGLAMPAVVRAEDGSWLDRNWQALAIAGAVLAASAVLAVLVRQMRVAS